MELRDEFATDPAGAVTNWTFGELRLRSNRLAGALRRAGVGRGDRVAVVAGQCLETALTHLAVWKLGAISVPMSSLFGPEALAYRLGDSGVTLAVVAQSNVGNVNEAAPGIPVIEIGPQFDALCSGAPIDRAIALAARPWSAS